MSDRAARPTGTDEAASGRAAIPPKPSDALEMLISRILAGGLAISCAVVLLGGVLLLARRGAVPDLSVYQPQPESLRSVHRITAGAVSLDPAAVILLGALLLVATPVARVALALVIFAFQRDRLYVAISLVLLAILGVSLLVGGGH